MKITFLGVGEAFDEYLHNVCLLIEATGRRMLIDCGATAPPAVWKQSQRADYLDGIFVSHLHADHIFGLPALLMRMWEDGRTRPFYLFGPVGLQRYIERMLKLAYDGSVPKHGRGEGAKSEGIPFTLRYRELQRSHRWDDWNLRVASTRHTISNLGLRLEAGDPQSVFCYSGDGMYTPTAGRLYAGADLVVHEGYTDDGETKVHCSLKQLERLQDIARPKHLAVVHMRRDLRWDGNGKSRIREWQKRYRQRGWLFPEPGFVMEF